MSGLHHHLALPMPAGSKRPEGNEGRDPNRRSRGAATPKHQSNGGTLGEVVDPDEAIQDGTQESECSTTFIDVSNAELQFRIIGLPQLTGGYLKTGDANRPYQALTATGIDAGKIAQQDAPQYVCDHKIELLFDEEANSVASIHWDPVVRLLKRKDQMKNMLRCIFDNIGKAVTNDKLVVDYHLFKKPPTPGAVDTMKSRFREFLDPMSVRIFEDVSDLPAAQRYQLMKIAPYGWTGIRLLKPGGH